MEGFMIWTFTILALELIILIGGEAYDAFNEKELINESNKIAQNYETELKEITKTLSDTRY